MRENSIPSSTVSWDSYSVFYHGARGGTEFFVLFCFIDDLKFQRVHCVVAWPRVSMFGRAS